jgi:hypothetical protein
VPHGVVEVAMKEKDDAAGDGGHGDSPRQDSQRPDHRDAGDAGGHESRNDTIEATQARPAPRPADAPEAPGERHADPPLPSAGRQSQRPGQDARYEARPGDRDDEELTPPDE